MVSVEKTEGGDSLSRAHDRFSHEWQIIFNNEIPNWGVDYSGKSLQNPETDALIVTAPSYNNEKVVEQFTIMFDKMDEQIEMVIMWDKTTVVLPIEL